MYEVLITRSAEKELTALAKPVRARIREHILALAANPRPQGYRQLRGGAGYRLRVGDYRVVYTIEETIRVVTVYRVAKRGDVYRNL